MLAHAGETRPLVCTLLNSSKPARDDEAALVCLLGGGSQGCRLAPKLAIEGRTQDCPFGSRGQAGRSFKLGHPPVFARLRVPTTVDPYGKHLDHGHPFQPPQEKPERHCMSSWTPLTQIRTRHSQ